MLEEHRGVSDLNAAGCAKPGSDLTAQVWNLFLAQVAVGDLGRWAFIEKALHDRGTQDARRRGVTKDARIEMKDVHGN